MVTARATPSVSEVLDAHRDAAVPSTAAGVGSAVFDTGPSQTRSSGAVAVVCLHGVPSRSSTATSWPSWPGAVCGGWRSTFPGSVWPTGPPTSTTGTLRAGSRPPTRAGALPPAGARHRGPGRVRARGRGTRPGRAADGPQHRRGGGEFPSTVGHGAVRPHRGLGRAWVDGMRPSVFAALMLASGYTTRAPSPTPSFEAYVHLLQGSDHGVAIQQIMRGFERAAAKEHLHGVCSPRTARCECSVAREIRPCQCPPTGAAGRGRRWRRGAAARRTALRAGRPAWRFISLRLLNAHVERANTGP